MAARTLLLKLERGGLIRLPRRQRPSSNGLRNRQAPLVAHATEPIRDALGDLRPLRLSVVESGSADLQLFNCLLRRYPLPRPPQHGGREPPLSGTRSRRPAAGLRAVRIGRVEVRRARCLHRMGTPGAGNTTSRA